MFSKKIKNTLLLQSHVATGSQTGQIKIKIKKNSNWNHVNCSRLLTIFSAIFKHLLITFNIFHLIHFIVISVFLFFN